MSGPAVVLLKLSMGRYPAVDAVVPFSLLVEVCEYYHRKKTAIAYVVGAGLEDDADDRTNAIYIADLEVTQQHLAMLLVRGDPGRALPGFVNPVKRAVKPIKSDEPGYVPGASCHVVISTQEITKGLDHGRFRVAMERSRGVSRTLMREFLSRLLSRYADEHPDRFSAIKKRRKKGERSETIQYRPTVAFHPQPNGSLKDDLQKGRIGGFKLVRGSTEFRGAAAEPIIRRLDVSLEARIAPTKDVSKVRKLVDRVRETLNSIEFEDLKLELLDDDDGQIKDTKPIPLDQLDDADWRYSKVVPIPNLGELTECYGSFYEPIKKFAVKCLSREPYWQV